MEDFLKIFKKKSLQDFPKESLGGLSKEIHGAILKGFIKKNTKLTLEKIVKKTKNFLKESTEEIPMDFSE